MREKTIKLLVLTWVLIFGAALFGGCGTFRDAPPEKQVLISYEIMGAVLEDSKPVLISLCDSGTLSAEDCKKARAAYNKAVDVYKYLKKIAHSAIDTGDGSVYRVLSIELMDLITEIQFYTGGL